MVIIKIIGAIVASVGFSVIFRLNVRHIPFSSLCGLISAIIYFSLCNFVESQFIVNMFASFAAAISSEIFARVCKAPSTVFLLPGCIILVPGGPLYYSMNNLINGLYSEALTKLLLTVEIGLGISTGIVIASLVTHILSYIFNFFANKKKKSE